MRNHRSSWGCCHRPHSRGFGGGLFRFLVGFGGGLSLGLLLRLASQMLTYFFGDIHRDRTGVRLLFGDPVSGQKINNRFGLHFQFAGQLVNSDLVCVAQEFASSV
jgi:hypothetical protein